MVESFMGDADQVAAPCDEVNKHVKASFQTMHFIVMMCVFYLFLSAVRRNISGGILWQMLIGTVVMLARHNPAISWVLLLVWLDGSSSCSRISWAMPIRWPLLVMS